MAQASVSGVESVTSHEEPSTVSIRAPPTGIPNMALRAGAIRDQIRSHETED